MKARIPLILALLPALLLTGSPGCAPIRRRAQLMERRIERNPLNFVRRPKHLGRVSSPTGRRPGGLAHADKHLDPPRCPDVRGTPMVWLLGSSTMGGPLGHMLRRELKRWGVDARLWGKASTGLARPDYFDWPAQVPKLLSYSRPDVFVVVLGTNDYQALRVTGRRSRKWGRKWLRWTDRRWWQLYGERVDRFLEVMAGKDRRRTVIYIGNTPFAGSIAPVVGPKLTKLIKERIERFDGPAYYIDVYNALLDERGRIKRKLRLPDGRTVPMFGYDQVHLSPSGMRWMMAEPIYRLLRPCLKAAKDRPLPRRQPWTAPARTDRRGGEHELGEADDPPDVT